MGKYILALDQGTTSSRAILFDSEQNILAIRQHELTQHYPHEGWVEQDPMEIWSTQYAAMLEVLSAADVSPADVAGIGITNQRETTILWDKNTGRPVHNAIVWQCRRTADIVDRLVQDGLSGHIRRTTGLVPDVIGGHGIASDVKSLNETYKLKEDGGILKQHGVVEYVNGIAPGVFVTVATDNEEIAYQMQYHSMGPGPLWTLYRPYHLCNLETPLTAAKVVIDGEPTIVPKNGLVSECITVAKIDLKAGQTIDGIGGYTTYGSICKHEEAKEKGYVPYGLVNHKAVMKRDVKKGELITYDDIELDTTTLIYKLRQEQDKIFG